MGILKRIYRKLVMRIYSVGKAEFEKIHEARLAKRAMLSGECTFYPSAEIINLASDPSKIVIGNNCHIYGMLLIYQYSGTIRIGSDCSLGPYSRIVSVDKVEIGNRVLIAHNVNIIDNISHPIDARERYKDFISSYTEGMKECDIKASAITIEDDVWIGFNSTIMRGVKIGKGAIIGAGSFVAKDVEPWTVNVGNPLRCIRVLDPVEI